MDLLQRLLAIDVSALSDADKTLPVVDPVVHAMVPDVRLAGPAFTVVAEDDHLPVMTALAEAAPGDVLVVATHGGTRRRLRRAVRDGGEAARARRDRLRRLLPRPARAACDRAARLRPRHLAALRHDGLARAARPGVVFGGVDVAAGRDRVRRRRRPADRGRGGDRRGARDAEAIGRAERAILAAQARDEALHDLTNHDEHVAALDRGEESRLAFRVDA